MIMIDYMQSASVLGGQQCPRKDKFGLAAHYAVGVRTIENWLARGIISAERKGKKLEFDVAECDRRLSSHKPSKRKK